MVGWRWTLLRCLLRKIPLVACRVEVVNMSMRSRIPRLPAFKLSCAMRRV